jgi:hypothetical protein
MYRCPTAARSRMTAKLPGSKEGWLAHLLVEGGGDGAMGVGRACVRAVCR